MFAACPEVVLVHEVGDCFCQRVRIAVVDERVEGALAGDEEDVEESRGEDGTPTRAQDHRPCHAIDLCLFIRSVCVSCFVVGLEAVGGVWVGRRQGVVVWVDE